MLEIKSIYLNEKKQILSNQFNFEKNDFTFGKNGAGKSSYWIHSWFN